VCGQKQARHESKLARSSHHKVNGDFNDGSERSLERKTHRCENDIEVGYYDAK
jgi:hypothetical protein